MGEADSGFARRERSGGMVEALAARHVFAAFVDVKRQLTAAAGAARL